MRKAETKLLPDQSQQLIATIADHDPSSVFKALDQAIQSYLALRKDVFNGNMQTAAEKRSLEYLSEIKKRMHHHL